jgi:hypothetical protein
MNHHINIWICIRLIAVLYRFYINNSVTFIPVARQRLCKRIPATHVHATIGSPSLGNGPVNTFPLKCVTTIGSPCLCNGALKELRQKYSLCFPLGPCKVVIREANSRRWHYGLFTKTDRLTDRQSQCDSDWLWLWLWLWLKMTLSKGTRTRERLRWRGPAAYTKDRPILSSERAPHKKNRNCQRIINIWSW